MKDVFGKALIEHFNGGSPYCTIRREDGFSEKVDISSYFVEYSKWDNFEKEVLKYAYGRVLDIGAGTGKHSLYLQNKGFEVYAIDISPLTVAIMKQRGVRNAQVMDLMELKFPENYFDAITLFHVFEHLAEPKQMLEIIAKIIKTNGIVVFSFPNISSFQSKIFKGKWLHLDPPRHLFFFEPKDFINIMQGHGFKIIKKHYFSLEQNPFGAVQSSLNLTTKKREVLFESLKGNKNYIKEYSKLNLFFQKIFFVFSMPFFSLFDLFSSVLGKSATVELTFIKLK